MLFAIMLSVNKMKYFEDLTKPEDIEFFNILQNGKFSHRNINKDYIHSKKGRTTFLCKACEIGSLDLVKWLLHSGADVNRKDLEYGNTPLIWSVISSHEHVAKYLIKRGASVYQRNNLGNDVYNYVHHDNQQLLSTLLLSQEPSAQCLTRIPFKSLQCIAKYRSAGNTTDTFGDTPIHRAIRRGNVSLLKKLIDNNYDVNAVNDYKETGLHLAVTKRKLKITKILMKKNCDMNLKDIDGNTPMHVAMAMYSCSFNENKIIVCLTKHNSDFSIKNVVGDTILHIAFQNKQNHLLPLLIKHTKEEDLHCFQMLLLAIHNNKKQIVELMFRKFKNIKHRTDEDENSALHYAITNEKYDMVRMIVEHVDINLQNKNGSTALHLAVKKKKNEIVGFLLSSNADVNLQNTRGETALHLSVSSNMLIFILLVDRCNISIKTDEGDTVLHRAAKYGESSYIPMIINSKSAETSVDEIALIDVQNKKGDTALHCACDADNFDEVLKLLDFNAQQYIINQSGQTCLDIAKEKQFNQLIELLSDDINIVAEKSFGYDTCEACKHVIGIAVYSYQCEFDHMYCANCADAAEKCLVCESETILTITRQERKFSGLSMSSKGAAPLDSFEVMFTLG